MKLARGEGVKPISSLPRTDQICRLTLRNAMTRKRPFTCATMLLALISIWAVASQAQQGTAAVLNLYYSNDLIGYLTPCG